MVQILDCGVRPLPLVIGEHATESFPATNGALRSQNDRQRRDPASHAVAEIGERTLDPGYSPTVLVRHAND